MPHTTTTSLVEAVAPPDLSRVSASLPTVRPQTTTFHPEAPPSPPPHLSSVASSKHPALPKPPNSKSKRSFNQFKTSSAINLRLEAAALAEVRAEIGLGIDVRSRGAGVIAVAGVLAAKELGISIRSSGPGAVAEIGILGVGVGAGAAIGGRGGAVGAERMGRGVDSGLGVGVDREVRGKDRRIRGRSGRRCVVVVGLILLS